MSSPRILLLVCGVLITAIALFLILRGLRGVENDPAASRGLGLSAAASGASSGGPDPAAEAPRWESYTWADSQAEAPPRLLAVGQQVVIDPFARAYAQRLQVNRSLRLEGLAPGSDPLALISGRVVRVGESVAGFRVIEIDARGVSLKSSAGRVMRLGLANRSPSAKSDS